MANIGYLQGRDSRHHRTATQRACLLQQSETMDITEKRRNQLRRLCNERFGGVIARLANAIGKAPNYISRVLREKKGIAENFCRDVEERLGLPHLWMDGLSEGEQPADVTAQLIDADFLHTCMTAVDVFRERTKSVVTDEQRTHFACDLYSTYFGMRPSVERMVQFLANWMAAIEKSGVRKGQ